MILTQHFKSYRFAICAIVALLLILPLFWPPKPCRPSHISLSEDALSCQNWHNIDLELFLPVAARQDGIDELKTFILPSLALFWPLDQRFKILLLTDGEAPDVGLWAQKYRELTDSYEMNSNDAKTRVLFNFQTIPIGRGWDRQQWLMFWADNFTSSEYVGFLDSDAVFATRVTYDDLFVDGKPIIRGMFGKPRDFKWWTTVPIRSQIAIGKPEVLNCMSYFPVIYRTRHFPAMREHIRKTMKKTTFDEAFIELMSSRAYSQFCIMCSYMYYYQHEDYYWTIRERQPDFKGPFSAGQFDDKTAVDQRYFERQIPSLAVHWNYESFKDQKDALKTVLQTGICYSMPENHVDHSKLCSSLQPPIERLQTLNPYEWTFEGFTFMWNVSELLKTHRKRLLKNDPCPHPWKSHLISKVLELS